MAIDPLSEPTLSLTQAARRLPRLRAGRPVHPSTVWRWALTGLRGIRLETVLVGGVRVTSEAALRRFFDRATVDAEPTVGADAGALLAIEPSASPAALMIRWFGTRYTLRVPARWAFTSHEVRLARAIGDVLAARCRAVMTPQIIAARSDLFQGVIEDR